MISEWFVEAMNHTCGPYDPEVDELALSGFQTVPSKVVSTPQCHPTTNLRCMLHFWPQSSQAIDMPIECGSLVNMQFQMTKLEEFF